ncbi:hypothetical protein [Hymenobacter sp. BT491]|uniref:hypothetical protein n=1 Tax=Hymenobacter sp. BT491 TaxID=2766779 RepID=UPI001653E67B|nr:hypothetical protein [Hymenobacter sp. BT491]MBC6988545.1 hypothetical protein [Hymenobacter sp. BT491]
MSTTTLTTTPQRAIQPKLTKLERLIFSITCHRQEQVRTLATPDLGNPEDDQQMIETIDNELASEVAQLRKLTTMRFGGMTTREQADWFIKLFNKPAYLEMQQWQQLGEQKGDQNNG